QRFPDTGDLVAQAGFFGKDRVHRRKVHAFRKKSSAPKLPDLSASVMGRPSPMLRVQGTPGSISGPILSARTPSAWTTAPEVSPPATRKRVKPSCFNMAAAS